MKIFTSWRVLEKILESFREFLESFQDTISLISSKVLSAIAL